MPNTVAPSTPASPRHHRHRRAAVWFLAACSTLQLMACATAVPDPASAVKSNPRVVQRDLGGPERGTRPAP
jgi:hypothetical protein